VSADLHAKLLAFISGEFERKEGRQCVKLELVYSQQGFRDEMLQSWIRIDEPEVFESRALTEKLVSDIIERTEGHADTFGQGTHRFTLRTHQHLGGRAVYAFKVAPSASTGGAGEDPPELAMTKSQGDMGIVAQHASQLMRNNTMMYQGTIGVLGATNRQLSEENTEIRARMRVLEKELDEARSNNLTREFELSVQMRKHARTDAGFNKLMQFGTIAMAKMSAGGEKTGPGAATGLAMMVFEFGKSLQAHQQKELFAILDFAQRAMLMEILTSVAPPPEEAPQPSKPEPPPNGAPTS
jgi:hypothetical protein